MQTITSLSLPLPQIQVKTINDACFASFICAFFAGFARILRFRGKSAQPRASDFCRVYRVSRALDGEGFNFLEFSRRECEFGLVGFGEFYYCAFDAVRVGGFRVGFSRKFAHAAQKSGGFFAPGLVLIPAALFGLLWRKVGFENGGFIIDLAPLAYAFVVYVYFVFGFGAFILFRKYQKYRGTQKGQQVGAILWAVDYYRNFENAGKYRAAVFR